MEVRAALNTRLTAAFPGAALTAAAVAWPNRPFEPVVGTRWYRASFLPGEPFAAGIGEHAANRHGGIFQVDVFEPVGAGEGAAITAAERIAAVYKRDTALTYSGVIVRIEKSWVEPAMQESDWFQAPVRIQWRADVAN